MASYNAVSESLHPFMNEAVEVVAGNVASLPLPGHTGC